MNILIFLIFASLAVATIFLGAFIWAVRSGQYEDTCTPSMRLLLETREGGKSPASPAGAGGTQEIPAVSLPADSPVLESNRESLVAKTGVVTPKRVRPNSPI